MVCPFCDSINSEEKKVSRTEMSICPECGGELQLDEYTSATKCPYCDNYLILDERVEGEYEPQLIISFHLDKETCKNKLRNKFEKFIFAPTDFLSELRLNEMKGFYVPFWFYDYDINYDFHGEGKKTRVWTSGNTEYTEISYFQVDRNMDIDFSRMPVDASIQMPDDVMDLMEPYDYKQLEAFDPKYMSGFYAEKYNMAAEFLENRVMEKMREDVSQLLKQTYTEYGSVRELRSNLSVMNKQTHYGLLPVWRYQYEYKNKNYMFYVNGQTGKIVGAAPLSKTKVWAYAGTLWACLTGILLLVNGILHLF